MGCRIAKFIVGCLAWSTPPPLSRSPRSISPNSVRLSSASLIAIVVLVSRYTQLMRSIRAAKTRSLVSDDQLRPIVPFEVIGLPETVISEGAVEANRGFGTGDRGLKLALLTASVGFNSSVRTETARCPAQYISGRDRADIAGDATGETHGRIYRP